MRKSNIVVYDNTVALTPATTIIAPEFNGPLGEGNQLALQAVIDLVSGTTPTFTLKIQHSADQINWVDRSATAEINGVSIPVATTTVIVKQDAGALPFLGYVRFVLSVGGTGTQAHVKVWVTTRDNA